MTTNPTSNPRSSARIPLVVRSFFGQSSPVGDFQLERYFDQATIARGIGYAQEGRVDLLLSDDPDHIVSRVRGSGANVYTVRIATDQPVEGTCTCPIGYRCKHVVATLLVVTGVDLDDEEPDEDDWDESGQQSPAGPWVPQQQWGPIPPRSPAGTHPHDLRERDFVLELPAPTADTEHSNEARTPQAEKPEQWRLVFAVGPGLRDDLFVDEYAAQRYGADTGIAHAVVIEPALQYRKKDGTYGRVAAYTASKTIEAPEPVAQELFRRIALTGGVAPLALHWDLIAENAHLPLFYTDRRTWSGVADIPVTVVPCEALRLTAVPICEPSWGGLRVVFDLTPRLSAGSSVLELPPGGHLHVASGFGPAFLLTSTGTLAWTEASAAVEVIGRSLGGRRQVSARELVRLREELSGLDGPVELDIPFSSVRVHLQTGTPVAEFRSRRGAGTRVGIRFTDDDQHDAETGTDGEYLLPVPDVEAHAEVLEQIEAVLEVENDFWMTEPDESAAYLLVDEAPVQAAVRTARQLVALGVTVVLEDPRNGTLREVRPAEKPVHVRIESGIDWFGLRATVDGKSADGWNDPLLRTAGVLDLDDQLVLLTEDDVARLDRLAAVLSGTDNGRVHATDLGLLDLIAEDADEVPADAQALVNLARAVQSGSGLPEAQLPTQLANVLRPYQLTGVRWLAALADHGLSGCLADDMGLGKTVQTLAFITHLRASWADGAPPRSLVVAPVSTLHNWAQEARRFTPDLRVWVHHGPTRSTTLSQAEPAQADLIITSYATLLKDHAAFGDEPFMLVCLDEAQAIKNPRTRTARVVRELEAQYRLALTGTPVENSVSDLWSIIDFLIPGLLGSHDRFKRTYRGAGSLRRDAQASDTGRESRERLRRVVGPFILRRTKDAVAPELPPKIENRHWCEMAPKQARFYDRLRSYFRKEIAAALADHDFERLGPLMFQAFTRLRQAAIYPQDADPAATGVPSTKDAEITELLLQINDEGHSALVFSQFVTALKRLHDGAAARGITTLYLDGATRDRQPLIDRFQNASEPMSFFISLKAGGLGLNLTRADYVLLCDPWWNPAVERQATDRAHRIGRTRPVMVYRVITSGTIEERVLELQERKRELFNDLIAENESLFEAASAEELLRLFE